jgi:DNA-binding LytR/AlgR family response regulator
MFIKQGNQYINLYLNDILFIESIDSDCKISCLNNTYFIKSTMKSLESKLSDYNFVRTHNKYIVNLKYIDSIDSNIMYLKNIYLNKTHTSNVLISQDKWKLIKHKIIIL